MKVNAITLPQQDARKLLGAANADAALLYLYIACGNIQIQQRCGICILPQAMIPGRPGRTCACRTAA